ncbi:MAG: universal stress protein [Pseudomonadota bacterium]|jgi:nucleotide-binding universal stress UspA family protein
MYKRILLPTDGSDLALAAAQHGLKLAKATGASVLALYASPPFETPAGFEFVPAPLLPVDVYEKSSKQAAAKYLGAISAAADKAGVPCKTRHVRSLSPADAIAATAEGDKCDLIVIGSHGRGSFRSLLLGSVTARVLALCAVPVLVHREPAKAKKKR